MQIARQVVIEPAVRVRGTVRLPGDKSVSHRYALLGALAPGSTTIDNYAPGGDCQSTLACIEQLGAQIDRQQAADESLRVIVHGRGTGQLAAARAPLDCGNSGSTMRMLAGVVAAHPFETVLVGDASLTRRPMQRVAVPLRQMGARIVAAEGERPPLRITGAALRGIDFSPPVPSAQVKSAVLFAGLHASGITTVHEDVPTRDHTERALETFGVELQRHRGALTIAGGQTLRPAHVRVPGDVSSAAFAAVAAGMLPGSDVVLDGVGLNPTRTALFDVLTRFGVDVVIEPSAANVGEPTGRVRVRSGSIGAVRLRGADIPAIIDELPILAVLATAGGELHVTDAAELRVKESDRITALVSGLRALGADADELPDGFHIRGGRRLTGGSVDAQHDHRLAMAFAIAALSAAAAVTIDGADAAAVSYPSFFTELERLRA